MWESRDVEALHQLQIATVYADDGVSGTLPLAQRPAGACILPDARRHGFDQRAILQGISIKDQRLTERNFSKGCRSVKIVQWMN